MVWGPIAFVLLAVAIWFVKRPEYVATSTLKSQSSATVSSRLAGLAAQFGISSIPTDQAESPQFYVTLLTSSDLLRAVVLTEYRFPTGPDQSDTIHASLFDLLPHDEHRPRDAQVHQAVNKLRSQVSATSDLESGVVKLSTRAQWPDLAVEVNRRMLQLLHQFNVQRRQSQATAEREFIQARLSEAQDQYHRAESALEDFLEHNRAIGDSPDLTFEQARLQRRVDFRQQIYTSLAQSYEQARIDEVRNTPVVTVIDNPEGSAQKAPPGFILFVLVSGFLGMLLTLALVALLESISQTRIENPSAYKQFEQLRHGLWNRLARPFSALRNRGKTS